MPHTQSELLAAILHDVSRHPDRPIRRAVAGESLLALQAARVGLASRPCATPQAGLDSVRLPDPGTSARAVAERLRDPDITDTDRISLAIAAANALLPPPQQTSQTFGQEVMAARGAGKKCGRGRPFPVRGRGSRCLRQLLGPRKTSPTRRSRRLHGRDPASPGRCRWPLPPPPFSTAPWPASSTSAAKAPWSSCSDRPPLLRPACSTLVLPSWPAAIAKMQQPPSTECVTVASSATCLRPNKSPSKRRTASNPSCRLSRNRDRLPPLPAIRATLTRFLSLA